MSSQGTSSSPGSPVLARVRVIQDALNYDDRSDLSEILDIISCSESSLSDATLSEVLPAEVRTIEGSDRLYSAHNPLYLLPLDQQEFVRWDRQHKVIRLGVWGLPILNHLITGALTRDPTGPKTVLDIGCGNGQWAIDLVTDYDYIDNLRVDAIDQATQVTSQWPDNVVFQIHDVNTGLEAFYGGYDVVHARCIASGIKSYRRLLQEAAKCLKPGGVVIFMEGDFNLYSEDRESFQTPVSKENPNGSSLQKWMQAVRNAQVKKCEITDSDDSPETLDKGLWQFDCYDQRTCGAGCIFTPLSPWVKSELPEEQLHYEVSGTLMRQDIKMFINSTEQTLIENGMTREEAAELKENIRIELQDGKIKMWKRWRLAWAKAPDERPSTLPPDCRPRLIGGPQRQAVMHELLAKVEPFRQKQCMQFTREEALKNVERLNNLRYSTRGQF